MNNFRPRITIILKFIPGGGPPSPGRPGPGINVINKINELILV